MASAEKKSSASAGKEGTVLGCAELRRVKDENASNCRLAALRISLLDKVLLQSLSFSLSQSSRDAQRTS